MTLPNVAQSSVAFRSAGLRVVSRVATLAKVIRLSPHDGTTETGRSKERYRRAALAGFSGAIAKGIRLLSSVITVRVTVGYLGAERFGFWMSLSSLVALLFGFADLGLASALQNEVSTANGKGDTEDLRKCISSAVPVLVAAPLGMMALMLFTAKLVPWPRLFNLHSALAAREAVPAVQIIAFCYLASIPLFATSRIQWGLQEGYRANVWDAAAAGLGLIGTVTAARLQFGLPALLLANVGTPLIANAANTIMEFGFRRKWLIPRLHLFDWRTARRLLGAGCQLLLIALGSCLATAAPLFAVGNRFGASDAGPFALVFKILAIPMTLGAVLGSSLWPAYAEAGARGDYQWVRRTLKRSVQGMIFVVAPLIGLLGIATPWIVAFWTRGSLAPSLGEGCSVSLFVIAVTFQSILWPPLVAVGRFTFPAVFMLLAGALCFLPVFLPPDHLSVPGISVWAGGCVLLSTGAMALRLRDVHHEAKDTELRVSSEPVA